MRADLGDQAEQLLAASSTPEMMKAATSLRETALSIRRLLTRRQLDARGTAVRLGMRLLSQLNSDVARADNGLSSDVRPQASEHGRV